MCSQGHIVFKSEGIDVVLVFHAPGGIHPAQQPLETVVTENSTLELLATGDDTEIVRWTVKKEGRLSLQPEDDWHGAAFFYIVEGRLRGVANGDAVQLESGSVLSAAGLAEPFMFRAEVDTTLLYITSRPAFHQVSQQVHELMALAVQVEEIDDYTAGHCKRIRTLSTLVGERLGLSPDAMVRLNFGSFLHDIGKCRIPKEILRKSGPLTADEWEIMKEHPRLGKELVDNTCVSYAGPVIYQHHERLDGSGYPHGLKGDEIMIEAQILGVVDSFDAMTTNRPYRKARSVASALDELRRETGVLFAEDVVQALHDVVSDGLVDVDEG